MAFRVARRLLPLLLLGHLATARRGGGSIDLDGEDDSGGSSGDDSSGDDSSGSSGSGPSSRRPCDWGARHTAFGLPGLYYDGTLTIRHHITDNTAWDEEIEDSPADEFTNCQNDDRSAKTYTYPALLLIGPTGNDSDTNPFHWSLRAFQPADQVRGPKGEGDFVDLEQRWVHIRSSDFVPTNATFSDYTAYWPARDLWRDADATRLRQVTRVYWPTEITSEGDVFSASAEYAREPPAINPDDYDLSSRSVGFHASQYVTLSDVCSWNQVTEDFMGYKTGLPRSGITAGESDYATTTPTVWLSEGATADMSGIGSDSMRLTLNNSLERVTPLSGDREAGCRELGQFEYSHFGGIHSSDDESASPRPWNLTLSVMLSFEGSLVRENSTSLEGIDGGKLRFGETYEALLAGETDSDNGSGGLSMGVGSWMSLGLASLLVAAVLI